MSDHPETDAEQPRSPRQEEVTFDLERTLDGVVAVRARIPEDALTAPVLGTERAGHGVVINEEGLVLTIGYLIAEADSVFLVDNRERTTPAHVVAYDQETGFGLLQALGRLDLPAVPLGSSAELRQGEFVIMAGQGGIAHSVAAEVMLKREFAGYWEYLLEEAVFTAPAHPNWGGCALLGADGTLRGIGSLLVQHVDARGETRDANMSVPIDLLPPILDDLLRYGRARRSPRPWLGMMTTEYEGHLVVAGVVPGGPAEAAGIEVGDVVLEVDGEPVQTLAEMFRTIWSLGEAGVRVPLTIYRKEQTSEFVVESANRYDLLKSPSVH